MWHTHPIYIDSTELFTYLVHDFVSILLATDGSVMFSDDILSFATDPTFVELWDRVCR